ncbi:C25 family cysteine peptidase [Flavihumibacter petaseus]|uniref:Gingipain domain-containing protein n=1 Tax=Flavihumibacter petaseus NBRC 106054 TaxID=1220578 RepID=A0A0E9MVP6_9BACT|nr:C25 family cysteine peptidase [Flavihumibacter petaseus]GAO41200.1 hypothetical protein FPE01S_01_02120 [Flavihumibacter petaseus NBRC 106054]
MPTKNSVLIPFRIAILLLVCLVSGYAASAQTYYNEWINFSNTYLKFKIGSDGIYRIPVTLLRANGHENTPVEQFRLFRNGEEIALYTSASTGPLPDGGYLEFAGFANDGKPDKSLYRNPGFQHTEKFNLHADSATYFLTAEATPGARRYVTVNNNVAGNTLPAEPWFQYTFGKYYKNKINPGFAADIEQYIYSSSYDRGEFWSSNDIRERATLSETVNNLKIATDGPNASFRYGAFGNMVKERRVQASVNSSILHDTALNYMSDMVVTIPISPSLLASGSATVAFTDVQPPKPAQGDDPYLDRMVVSFFEISYPHLFDFNNATYFPFSLDPRSEGYYLDITGFAAGGTTPILYDLNSNERFVANVQGTKYRFALPGSAAARKLILFSQSNSVIKTVQALTERKFVNYSDPANEGDFAIISNPRLYNGANGNNPVEDYRLYRQSVAGGSHNAKIYDINELTDQFAYGIKGHPLAVKNFIRYSRQFFSTQIAKVFLIGKGVVYSQYRFGNNERPRIGEQNLVPTHGYPGSDNLLASPAPDDPVPATEIGRLSAVYPNEVEDYLAKVKEYEAAQANPSNRMEDKLWMKNVLNVTGATDALLGASLCNSVTKYAEILEDTLTGAAATILCKNVAGGNDQAGARIIKEKMEEGVSLLTYFGHSSATTLEFSIQDPYDYNNAGKYPVFSVNGCYAGDFFTYSDARYSVLETLTEKYVLAKQRGAIAFIASTHYGVSSYLTNYLDAFFEKAAKTDYGADLAKVTKDALAQLIVDYGSFDFVARSHAEQITLHGDPGLKMNFQERPDYVIEESTIRIIPTLVSVNDQNYKVQVKWYNQGKATADSVQVEVSRTAPDGTVTVLHNLKHAPTLYADSVTLEVPIVASKDKGTNKITVTIDGKQLVGEMDETNNTVTKSYFIYEDEASPAFPYNYSIVSDPAVKFYASTADPFASMKQYVMEIDTTAEFNSSLKKAVTLNSRGGLLEFDPQMTYLDSTVYYWRTSFVPGDGGEFRWSQFSFLFKKNVQTGFNQSHYFQHSESGLTKMVLNANRQWDFGKRFSSLIIRLGMYPTSGGQDNDFAVLVNDQDFIQSACVGHSLAFNVFDPRTLIPWKNVDDAGNNLYRFGSGSANCARTRNWNFEFSYMTPASRKLIMDFMDSIPDGYFVAIRSFDYNNPQSYSKTWMADTSLYGSGNSLYHKLLATGLTNIDDINAPKCWGMIYQKNAATFTPVTKISAGLYDRVIVSAEPETPTGTGSIMSPEFGPAKTWKQMVWKGHATDAAISNDKVKLQVIGVTASNARVPLKEVGLSETTTDISDIDASQYPRLALQMNVSDSVDFTAYQLDFWRLLYDPVPEGAVAPNLFFVSKDTVELGQTVDFGIAFKNISNVPFDSLKVKVTLTDGSNSSHILPVEMLKPLNGGDTVMFRFTIDSKSYTGLNTLYVDFNPDGDQPEMYHFNNFFYKNIYVQGDKHKPLLDVTFDGVHILNDDIVSAKPHIQIKLKDESKFLLLKDTSLMRVRVRFPDQTVKTYRFDNDTVRFTPATSAADNTATIDFSPAFLQTFDQETGIDRYELMVNGKDASNNPAGNIEYSINFTVINKPMISNLLNYPNPFSTSTAFVFTLTGSEVPTNFKIQIMTVTGKIVREITGPELGPLRIGRNITEFKWDGTDQYGQRLANGVYLYRVVTTLNGKKLDKYKAVNDNTDKYFSKGYGKMYLIR